ncbi:hypothetical protein OD761_27890, partial [Pseudomonas aeruginosa]|nr:hypothetical protein [Pseudomonas aeruginosa]
MDLDRLYLPHWQFSEHHQRLIDAPAAAVLDAVEDLLRFDDPLVRAFLVLREAPGRLAGLLGRRNDLAGRPRFGLHEFTRLERRGAQQLTIAQRCRLIRRPIKHAITKLEDHINRQIN